MVDMEAQIWTDAAAAVAKGFAQALLEAILRGKDAGRGATLREGLADITKAMRLISASSAALNPLVDAWQAAMLSLSGDTAGFREIYKAGLRAHEWLDVLRVACNSPIGSKYPISRSEERELIECRDSIETESLALARIYRKISGTPPLFPRDWNHPGRGHAATLSESLDDAFRLTLLISQRAQLALNAVVEELSVVYK